MGVIVCWYCRKKVGAGAVSRMYAQHHVHACLKKAVEMTRKRKAQVGKKKIDRILRPEDLGEDMDD